MDGGMHLAHQPHVLAGAIAFGPIVFAAILMRVVGDRADMRWPFHKVNRLRTAYLAGLCVQTGAPLCAQDGAPKFGLHIVVGFVLAVLPVYHLLMTLLAPPEQRFYCQLWGMSACASVQ